MLNVLNHKTSQTGKPKAIVPLFIIAMIGLLSEMSVLFIVMYSAVDNPWNTR